MKGRIGRFSVADQFADDPVLRAILSRCDVIAREPVPPSRLTIYLAYSPDFDLSELNSPPVYDWLVHTQPDGSFTVEARRFVPDPASQARIARLLEGFWD